MHTKIFLCFILLFLSFTAQANIENNHWIFHAKNSDKSFGLVNEVRGTPYVSLNEISKTFKLKIQKLPENEIKITYQNRWCRLSPRSAQIISSWVKGHSLSRSILKHKEDWHVPIDFGDRVLRPLLYSEVPSAPQPDRPLLDAEVLIDPGHGGNDYGAHFGNLKEKDLTLSMGLLLAEKLRALLVSVSMTRHKDLFLTLQERTQMARRSRAKLFVSLHMNSEPKASSSGYEIYVLSLDESNQESLKAVASENQIIPRELPEGVERTLADLRATANFESSLGYAKISDSALKLKLSPFGRSIKTAPFYVLYGVSMPALLIEFGFINSSQDQKWIKNPKEKEAVVSALAQELAKSLKSAKP